ncbi:FAD/NAD(P)-binding domain-containing protein [Mytilinidion resinicola]|uniref:FAD/NAD(P)-binding domain-containing protein n=1 Tax=Mytilinidion resinicola TaxID=574789 RepID=A0A6A6YT42_9PEZI|nr:FAD/NAD(P)-binding domain-containing protein [Mytilinidion resinicola]KAF2812116.1 FAD/NAD(P)-binding domain-containing protein [Mytilinidion resinicola]
MRLSLLIFLALASFTVSTVRAATGNDDGFQFKPAAWFGRTTDVCIIGGGASGTYAAVRLKDMGKTVTVIEAKNTLGGHTETWTDPASGQTVELGVETWHVTNASMRFVDRFSIEVEHGLAPNTRGTVFVDYQTGKNMVGGVGYAWNDILAAQAKYGEQRAKYANLSSGYYLGSPVPEDFMLPFIDFAKKYQLEAILYFFYLQQQGGSDFLRQPALYVLKEFDLDRVVHSADNVTMRAKGPMHEIYDCALKDLGDDVLLNSSLVKTMRLRRRNNKPGVFITVETPSGYEIIQAKALLIAAPPTSTILDSLWLEDQETRVLSKIVPHYYYTGLINSTGLPNNTVYNFAATSTEFHIPEVPGLYWFRSTSITGVFDFKYGHNGTEMSSQAIQDDIIAKVRTMHASGDFKTTGDYNPQIVKFSSHSPFDLQVSPDDIRNGFYQRLYALQGLRSTYYTGAAFGGHDSGELWDFTEALVSKIAATL